MQCLIPNTCDCLTVCSPGEAVLWPPACPSSVAATLHQLRTGLVCVSVCLSVCACHGQLKLCTCAETRCLSQLPVPSCSLSSPTLTHQHSRGHLPNISSSLSPLQEIFSQQYSNKPSCPTLLSPPWLHNQHGNISPISVLP